LGKPMYAAIDDFENLTYANAISVKNIQYLLYLVKLFVDHYPEILKTLTAGHSLAAPSKPRTHQLRVLRSITAPTFTSAFKTRTPTNNDLLLCQRTPLFHTYLHRSHFCIYDPSVQKDLKRSWIFIPRHFASDLRVGRRGLVVRSRRLSRRVPGSKPNSTEDLPRMGLLEAKSYAVTNWPPADGVRKFGEGVPARVWSSSSDHGSR
ncbi:hypothetical protein AVEN_76638-1, partial [Araneus ventricosus]